MLNQEQILSLLEEKGVRPADIARTLDLPSSRVAEMRRKSGDRRKMTLEEAVTLTRRYDLDRSEEVGRLSQPVAIVVVSHIVGSLGMAIDDTLLSDLAKDAQALSAFAADPRVSSEALEAFSQGLLMRRQLPSDQRLPLRGN